MDYKLTLSWVLVVLFIIAILLFVFTLCKVLKDYIINKKKEKNTKSLVRKRSRSNNANSNNEVSNQSKNKWSLISIIFSFIFGIATMIGINVSDAIDTIKESRTTTELTTTSTTATTTTIKSSPTKKTETPQKEETATVKEKTTTITKKSYASSRGSSSNSPTKKKATKATTQEKGQVNMDDHEVQGEE